MFAIFGMFFTFGLFEMCGMFWVFGMVKVFNTQIFALWWMTRACSEYLLLISRTPGAVDIDLVPEFISACEQNG